MLRHRYTTPENLYQQLLSLSDPNAFTPHGKWPATVLPDIYEPINTRPDAIWRGIRATIRSSDATKILTSPTSR